LILGTSSKFAQENNMLALSVCFPQPYPSTGRTFPLVDHIWITSDPLARFYENEFDEMGCILDSNENLRSLEKYPALP